MESSLLYIYFFITLASVAFPEEERWNPGPGTHRAPVLLPGYGLISRVQTQASLQKKKNSTSTALGLG